MTSFADWRSSQGDHCRFNVGTIDGIWAHVSGIYMMCSREGTAWVPKYIGQAESFRDRLTRHERWPEAVRLGATHVLAMCLGPGEEMDRVERILIRELQPPLNVQLRGPGGLLGTMAAPTGQWR